MLGIERVILHTTDTLVGSAGSTSASRQTVVSGGAVKAACKAVLEDLFERARRDARLLASELGVENGFVTADGERVAPVEELLATPIECTRVWRHAPTTRSTNAARATSTWGSCSARSGPWWTWTRSSGSSGSCSSPRPRTSGAPINPQSVIGPRWEDDGGCAWP